MTRLFAPAVVAAALLGVLAAPVHAQQHTLTGRDVAIYNLVGSITVTGAAAGEVTATVRRAGRDAGELRIETGRVGDSNALRIFADSDRIVYPEMGRGSRSQIQVSRNGTFFDVTGVDRARARSVTIAGSGRGVEAWADVSVALPPGRTLRLYAAVGSVDVSNVEGAIHVRTSSARSEIRNVRGSLQLQTSSGGATIADIAGAVRATSSSGTLRMSNARGGHQQAESSSGGIELNNVVGDVVRATASSGTIRGSGVEGGDVEMRASSGAIRLDGVRADRYTARTSSGRITLQNVSAGSIDAGASSGSIEIAADARLRSLQAETSSGSVRATLPRSFGGAVEIRTSSGSINVDLPVSATSTGRRELVGRIGTGDGNVRIRTTSGSVRISGN